MYYLQAKEKLMKEVNALKESLDLAKSRSEFLENTSQDTKSEAQRLKQVRPNLPKLKQAKVSKLQKLMEIKLGSIWRTYMDLN